MRVIFRYIKIRNFALVALLGVIFASAFSSGGSRLTGARELQSRDTVDCYQMYQDALNAKRVGKTKEAKEIADRLIKRASESGNLIIKARTYVLLADISEKDNQLQLALKHWLNAIGLIEKMKDNNQLQMAYERTAQIYAKLDYKSLAMAYYEKAYNLWKESNQNTENVVLLENVAAQCYGAKIYDRSLSYYNKLRQIYTRQNDSTALVGTLLKIIDIYNKTNRKDEAIQLNKELTKAYEARKDTTGIISSLNSLGYNYVLAKDYSNASNSFLQALKFAKKTHIDPLHLCKIYTNLAIAYQNQQDYNQAIHYLTTSEEILQKLDEQAELAKTENLLGMCYFFSTDFYNANVCLQKAINSSAKAKEPEITRDCYQNYSQILQAGNEYERALKYYQLYLHVRDSLLLSKRMKEQELVQKQNIAEKNEKDQRLNIASEDMKDLELKQSKLENQRKQQEIELLKNQQDLKDAAHKQQQLEQQKRLQELEIERKNRIAELQQRELQSLQQQKEIQGIKLKKNELEQAERRREIRLLVKEKQNQQQKIEIQTGQERFYKWVFGLFIFIFLLVLIGFLYSRRINKKISKQKLLLEETYHHLEDKNKEISAIKDMIEQKNESITASIMYARRIQNAILPPEDIFAACFADSFVHYKPRDIVSGDFYWAKQLGNKIVLAVADCTGHGVPGAFMSMLGVALLNEISGHKNISSDYILHELRDRVKSSLRQTGKTVETKDGMDIALCLIDMDNLHLEFSGAYSPIFIIRNGELKEVKGDRMPIGIHLKERETFTKIEMQLEKDDQLYLFSDGYVSQFGGDKGQTFKSKNFKELLLSIHNKPMEEQNQQLDESYNNWRGNHPQVDDILIVGVKI